MKTSLSILFTILMVGPVYAENASKEPTSFKLKFNVEIEIPTEIYLADPTIAEAANSIMRMFANAPQLKQSSPSLKVVEPKPAPAPKAEPAALKEPIMQAPQSYDAKTVEQPVYAAVAAYRQPIRACDEDYHSHAKYWGEANTYLANITAAHDLSFCKRIDDESKEEEVIVYDGYWRKQCKRLNLVFTDDQLRQLGIYPEESSFVCEM